uniref:Secreted protein n=1 Tax=Steinernema glaseri TaxID=37863 RepID=A0A1I7Y2X5_9BILA
MALCVFAFSLFAPTKKELATPEPQLPSSMTKNGRRRHLNSSADWKRRACKRDVYSALCVFAFSLFAPAKKELATLEPQLPSSTTKKAAVVISTAPRTRNEEVDVDLDKLWLS